jgi:hypothetical protein
MQRTQQIVLLVPGTTYATLSLPSLRRPRRPPIHPYPFLSHKTLPSKPPDLFSSLDPQGLERDAVPFASCTLTHACPTRQPGERYIYNPSSRPFPDPCRWRQEKEMHTRMHLWFVTFCAFPLSDSLLVPSHAGEPHQLFAIDKFVENTHPLPPYSAHIFQRTEG